MLALFSLLLAVPAHTLQLERAETPSDLDEILKRMSVHDARQERRLIGYRMHRTFYAANKRFNKESTLEVETRFQRPDRFESEVVRSAGSEMIRKRVFDKILEEERKAHVKDARQAAKITPANYTFKFVAQEDCDGRPCHRLRITPKRKDKYSINGQIWIDAEDGAIVRMLGSPAKSPSFWTRRTEIERRYGRVDGIWLCTGMESTSDIFLAGRSTLKVDYTYVAVHTESQQQEL